MFIDSFPINCPMKNNKIKIVILLTKKEEN